MSDQNLSLPERVADSSLLRFVSRLGVPLVLAAILWLGSTVTTLDRQVAEGQTRLSGQIAELRAELTAGALPQIATNKHDIERIQDELQARTRDRFTATDAAALELRLLREIAQLQAELHRLVERWEKTQ